MVTNPGNQQPEQVGEGVRPPLHPLLRHRWQALVFFTEFLYMGLELLASRLLAPYFGTTLDVWTAILGTVLLASAVGNHLGGQVADGQACSKWLARSLVVLMATFFVMPVLSTIIGSRFQGHVSVVTVLMASIMLFAIPGICIGSVTPMVVALHGRDNEDGVGKTSADIYVAMTIGGIVGTFMTGFVLVPLLGSTMLAYAMGGLAFMLACIIGLVAGKASVVTIMVVAIGVSGAGIGINETLNKPHLPSESDSRVDFWQDTRYGHVHVFDSTWGSAPVRILNVDGGFESAMRLTPGEEEEPVFDYVNVICQAVSDYELRKAGATTDAGVAPGTGTTSGDGSEPVAGGSRVLCLGGGAYSIPRKLVTGADDRQVSVMEIDEGVTDVARKWFHLKEVEDKVGDRLSVIHGDARVSLANSDDTYDVIINDTFAGNVPVRTLATKEAAELVKSRLSDRGIYIANVIGTAQSDHPDMLAWEQRTLESVFEYVYVIAVRDANPATLSNHMVIATDNPDYVPPTWAMPENVSSTAETRVLTDDDSPVEWIVSFNEK